VETCVEEKEKLEQAINDKIALKNELSGMEGKLQEVLNKNEGLESEVKSLEGKLDEANKYIAELKAELQQVNEDAEKKACPGEGIWVIPSKDKSFEL
jgi:predicted nuclease with TOPRIM domain